MTAQSPKFVRHERRAYTAAHVPQASVLCGTIDFAFAVDLAATGARVGDRVRPPADSSISPGSQIPLKNIYAKVELKPLKLIKKKK